VFSLSLILRVAAWPIRTAALAMGGDWHDLGGSLSAGSEHSVSLQPLARIDDQPERAWAAEWVVAILAKEGVAIDPTAKEHVWSALTSLASSPVNERTITGLAVLLQSTALKQALQPYCVGGPSGRLLDAETEQLGSAPVQAFESEGLIGASAAPAVRDGHRLVSLPGVRPDQASFAIQGLLDAAMACDLAPWSRWCCSAEHL
jgi:type IV secretory pathway VirB4 component